MNIAEITEAERKRKLAAEPPSPLNTWDEDPCCGRRLQKALRENANRVLWSCPKCGAVWKAKMIGTIKHWSPVVFIEVFKP